MGEASPHGGCQERSSMMVQSGLSKMRCIPIFFAATGLAFVAGTMLSLPGHEAYAPTTGQFVAGNVLYGRNSGQPL